tara:strand:- start:1502 stop:1912 length:411 start_codon:yes stop_codon:yes gene_type:complete
MTFKIVTKYIKDLSFEITDAKSYFLLEKNIKDFTTNFDIKSKKINDNVIEVDTTLYIASKKDRQLSPISICLSSLVNFEKKFEKEELQKIILIEIPKLVYPEIRGILVYLFEKSGFKHVNLDKEIDFNKFYENRNN